MGLEFAYLKLRSWNRYMKLWGWNLSISSYGLEFEYLKLRGWRGSNSSYINDSYALGVSPLFGGLLVTPAVSCRGWWHHGDSQHWLLQKWSMESWRLDEQLHFSWGWAAHHVTRKEKSCSCYVAVAVVLFGHGNTWSCILLMSIWINIDINLINGWQTNTNRFFSFWDYILGQTHVSFVMFSACKKWWIWDQLWSPAVVLRSHFTQNFQDRGLGKRNASMWGVATVAKRKITAPREMTMVQISLNSVLFPRLDSLVSLIVKNDQRLCPWCRRNGIWKIGRVSAWAMPRPCEHGKTTWRTGRDWRSLMSAFAGCGRSGQHWSCAMCLFFKNKRKVESRTTNMAAQLWCKE